MKKYLRWWPIFLLLILSTGTFAQTYKLPLSLTAKIDGPSGLEQVSLVFSDEKAILVINSNFLTPSQWPAWLGVFEKQLDDELKMIQTILNADFGNSQSMHSKHEKNLGPHRLQILLGENEVPTDSATYVRLKNTLIRVMSEVGAWKATNGAKVTQGPGSKLLYDVLGKMPVTTKTQTCPKQGACKIPQAGLIWIKK